MISDAFAKKQTTRLAQMQGFPRDAPEALRDLALAIQAANTEEIAIAAIDNFKDTATSETRCPMPAEIRKWIYSRQEVTKPEPDTTWRYGNCKVCQGYGIKESISVDDVNSIASYCDCQAGRLRQHDEHDEYPPERLNAARAKMLERGLKTPKAEKIGAARVGHLSNEYFGDY